MTNFEKIKEYYDTFDENNRLINDNSGKLEYKMTMKILEKYLPKEATILDLGGATGAYTFPLAERGYKIYLADLSDTLINIAKGRLEKDNNSNVIIPDRIINKILRLIKQV